MKKPSIGVLLSVVLLLGGVALAGWVGLALQDGEAFERALGRAIAERTGRTLEIDGPSRLVFWPPLGIAVQDVRLSGPPGLVGPPLARIGEAELRLSPWPLLLGRLETASVRLDDVRLHLVRAGAEPAGPLAAPAVESATAPAPVGEPRPAAPVTAGDDRAPMRLGPLRIRNLTLSWEDGEGGEVREIGGIDLSTEALVLGQPTGWRLAVPLTDVGPIARARLRGEGALTLGRDGIAIGSSPVRLGLEDLVMADGRRGALELEATVSGDRLAGRYALERFGIVARLDTPPAGDGGEARAAHLTGRAALDLPGRHLALVDLALDADGLQVGGDLAVAALSGAPTLTGHLALAEVDLRDWLTRHGMRLPSGQGDAGWRRVAGEATLAGDGEGLTLAPLALHVDEARLDGTLRLLFTRPLGIRFDLTTDRLELGGPRAAEGASASGEAARSPTARAAGSGGGAPAQALAPGVADGEKAPSRRWPTRVAALRRLDLEGRLRVGHLGVRGLAIAPADLAITSRAGVLEIAQRGEAGGFYEGRLDGRLEVDVRGEQPHGHLVAQARRVAVGPLLEDLRGAARLEGRGDLDLDLTAAGTGADDLRASLNGRLGLAIRDGRVPGVDLEGLIDAARARLRGETPERGRGQGTAFSELTATAEARDGVLHNDDLAGRADHLTLTGRGTIDLVRRRLDYRLQPVLVDPPPRRALKELEGIPIPVEVSGPLGEPSWSVDLAPVLREVARRRLDGRGDRLIERLEDRLGVDGVEGLRDLLGR
ncbi:AsmA family protein [Thiococcus pfennigii]|uniref:AsmA family protein n=1 Tax=Thiococcus pfennigii TaxID=1057 RepID=UPI001902DA2B|nr:AsmA family protein [Thiococcus pfennigii]MBK1732108.1 hypothetical protein [Thiococcus pfennigii]